MKQNDYKFGNFVCELREEKGMTQAQLAAELGVTAAAVSKWENGEAKPRVDTIIKLAGILGVRTEELIGGERIPENSMDPEKIREISARCRNLQKIDSHSSWSVKICRLLAWVIDWNITGFAVIIPVFILFSVYESVASENIQTILILIILPLMLMFPIGFVLRDLFFKGRSPGKRFFGLAVADGVFGDTPAKSRLAVRNLFLLLYPLDAVILLVTGRTIGDRVGHTYVVPERAGITDVLPDKEDIGDPVSSYTPPKKRSRLKSVLVIIGVFALFIAMIMAVITAMLEGVKKTDEYRMAYGYLINSGVVEYLGADEDDIRFSRYQSTVSAGESTKQFTFTMNRRSVTVVCHGFGGEWTVCRDCTGFGNGVNHGEMYGAE